HDGPLIALGTTGVITALLMLNRTRTTRGHQRLASIPKQSQGHPLGRGAQPCSEAAACRAEGSRAWGGGTAGVGGACRREDLPADGSLGDGTPGGGMTRPITGP